MNPNRGKIAAGTLAFCAFLFAAGVLLAQSEGEESQGSVPAELARPARGERARLPEDTVIGELGPGAASAAEYAFARRVASALLAGDAGNPALGSVNRALLDDYLAMLESAEPAGFRLGGGRPSPDGSVSFIVRFVGRELGITGELFVRYTSRQAPASLPPQTAPQTTAQDREDAPEEEAIAPEPVDGDEEAIADAYEEDGEAETPPEPEPEPEAPPAAPAPAVIEWVWVFDGLILEAPRSREEENAIARQSVPTPARSRLF
ncbi:MAG: hypothetical protein FWE09_04690 [Treponema sp.]|nr:hypothetical protein [Treponema sp.]